MDPKQAYIDWRDNGHDRTAAEHYNAWIKRGGYGLRVQLHPALDLWMMGAKYGEVIKLGTKWVHVKLDHNGSVARFHPDNIIDIA